MEQEGHLDIQQGLPSQTANDLFDYDVGLDEILQHTPTESSINAPRPSTIPGDTGLGLGLDEEVKVTRKRQPVAKLDEARLLSQAGIPRLRRTAKQKLKFKGKGHEFSDAARLLQFYQLWLDDLFPRAKFADGLTIIEKLGHHKRLQAMRREWIEEEKPKVHIDDTTQDLQAGRSNLPIAITTRSHHAMDAYISSSHSVGHSKVDKEPSAEKSDVPAHGLFILDDDNTHRAIARDVPEDDDELETLLREQQYDDATTKNSLTLADLDADGDGFEAMEELNILTPT
ncbi:chromosome segregation in meiosis protein 3 [Aspergillus nomiae NRRL 13137]|uniref:Chromosome segregation in meiosis protein n=1 Tax=Aspergillus nomiae NRRL (strain ATCC 15546 / NRRL 13137 / CBS 260.88 / M93) TaxID=1509407 RepID=A0A0L1J1Y7_ASPN3|nr:chromosome segregation in meiosis protein 3 [Aspergillus nomiae NRRL 13137]KNG85769.1 chromosome segregation in meiosis protein 3 [Aspergillus nomiae NRRL 13137]